MNFKKNRQILMLLGIFILSFCSSLLLIKADDGYEYTNEFITDNNTKNNAFRLENGQFNCTSADDDWYSVMIKDINTISVKITFNHTEKDLDLKIYNQTDNLLNSSTSSTNLIGVEECEINGTAIIPVDETLTLYIFINSTTSIVANYTLEIIIDDNMEENDSQLDAKEIFPTSDLLYFTARDDDWYFISVPAGHELFVGLGNINGDHPTFDFGNLELELISDNGSIIAADYTPEALTRDLYYTVPYPDAQNIFIKIVYKDEFNHKYVISIVVSEPVDDPFDYSDGGNDNATLAHEIFEKVHNLIQLDDDWYKLHNNADLSQSDFGTIEIAISGDDLRMGEMFRLDVYDDQLILLDSKETIDDNSFNITVSGEYTDYYFKISGSNWGRNYSLDAQYVYPEGDGGDGLSDILENIPGYPAISLITMTLFSVGLIFLYINNKRKK
jgi:hypothetical protein